MLAVGSSQFDPKPTLDWQADQQDFAAIINVVAVVR